VVKKGLIGDVSLQRFKGTVAAAGWPPTGRRLAADWPPGCALSRAVRACQWKEKAAPPSPLPGPAGLDTHLIKSIHNIKSTCALIHIQFLKSDASWWLNPFRTRNFTLKTKTLFGECYTCLRHETKKGVVRVLVIFRYRTMFSHINGKLSPRPFE